MENNRRVKNGWIQFIPIIGVIWVVFNLDGVWTNNRLYQYKILGSLLEGITSAFIQGLSVALLYLIFTA